jgi:hypothetical protein
MMGLFAARDRATDWLALSLLPDRIEVTQVERRAGARPTVRICDSYARRGAAVEGLRKLRKSLRADRFQCSALLQPGDYQMQLVEAPSVPADELKAAVRWKLKDLLDYPVDAATIDVADVLADAGRVPTGRLRHDDGVDVGLRLAVVCENAEGVRDRQLLCGRVESAGRCQPRSR